jgi:hypothetical protein
MNWVWDVVKREKKSKLNRSLFCLNNCNSAVLTALREQLKVSESAGDSGVWF